MELTEICSHFQLRLLRRRYLWRIVGSRPLRPPPPPSRKGGWGSCACGKGWRGRAARRGLWVWRWRAASCPPCPCACLPGPAPLPRCVVSTKGRLASPLSPWRPSRRLTRRAPTGAGLPALSWSPLLPASPCCLFIDPSPPPPAGHPRRPGMGRDGPRRALSWVRRRPVLLSVHPATPRVTVPGSLSL